MDFAPDHLREMIAEAQARYPAEACGLVLGSDGGPARHVVMPNVYDAYHAKDPGRFPRTSRTAYLMHPMKLMDEVDRAGGLRAIWHSHCDVGAYFSDEDVRVALGGGDEPLWPGVAYLVLSVRNAGVDAARVFTWSPADHAYVGTDVPLPG